MWISRPYQMVKIQKVSHDKLEKKTWYNMTVLKLTNYLIYGVRGLRGRLEERGLICDPLYT